MKKTLSVIFSVLICGTLLAGCARSGGEVRETTIAETTTETTDRVVPKKKKAVVTAETTAETTAKTTNETTAETTESETIAPSSSGNPFQNAYYGLTGGSLEPFKNSNTYKLAKELKGTNSLYFSYTSDSESCECAIEGKNVFVRSANDGYSMYIVNNVMTMYDETTKTGVKYNISEDDISSLGLNGVLDAFDFKNDIDKSDQMMMVYKDVDVNGKKYTFEIDLTETYFYAFDSNGKFATYQNLNNMSSNLMIFSEFTATVPADIWIQPTGYEIIEMDSLQ